MAADVEHVGAHTDPPEMVAYANNLFNVFFLFLIIIIIKTV